MQKEHLCSLEVWKDWDRDNALKVISVIPKMQMQRLQSQRLTFV